MHAIPGEPEDPVIRLQRFRAEHPEITITNPGPDDPFWNASRDGEHLCHAYWLKRFLDKLEALVAS